MLSASFNLQETIERLEQAQAPHALAVVVAQLLQENAASAAKEQTVQVQSAASGAEFGVPTVKSYPADALLRLEKKIDEGFNTTDKRLTQIDTRIDKLHAEMDRRFELVAKEFELTRQDVNNRFEAFKADLDRRFELVSKDIEIAKNALRFQIGGMIGAGAMLLFAALRYLPAVG